LEVRDGDEAILGFGGIVLTWCYVPKTDCPCVPAAVASIWASCSLNPDSTRDAMSNGKTIPDKPSSPRSEPDISPPPLSGMMSAPSTAGRGADTSTRSSRGIPANHFPPPDSEKASATNGTCGPKSPASSARSDPDGSSSKTSPVMSRWARTPCCESYGAWASRLRLAYSQRKKSARRMKGSAGSAWPTPMAGTPAQNGNSAAGNSDFSRRAEELAADAWTTPQAHDVTARGSGQKPTAKAGNACLARDAAMWATPDTPSGGRALPPGTTATGKTPDGRKLTVGLENQATMWGTPRGSDGEKGGPNMSFGAGGHPLPSQAAQWPTPASRDHKGENSADHLENGTGRLHLDQLPNFVAHRFSRPDPLTWPHGGMSLRAILNSRRLFRLATSRLSPATLRRLSKRENWNKRRLNPVFVSSLMGWPTGHALCGCSETEWYRFVQHMRGALSQLPTACGPWIWKPEKSHGKTPEPEHQTFFDVIGGEPC